VCLQNLYGVTMITIVMYQKYDSAYSDRTQGHEEAMEEEGILCVTEDIHKAFKKIIEHMEENPEEDIDYDIQFWLAEEIIMNSAVRGNVTIEDVLQLKEVALQEIKNFLH